MSFPLPPPRRSPPIVIREAPESGRRSSLRTFFDARFRARWWVLVPVCWGLLLVAFLATWYVLH